MNGEDGEGALVPRKSSGALRSRRGYYDETSEEDDSDDNSNDDSDDDHVRLPLLTPEEEEMADRAERRIRKAHAKGRTDVKLSKEELAAYQKRLQFLQEQKRRRQRRQRVAIPLTQLGSSTAELPQLPATKELPSLEENSGSADNADTREMSPELGGDISPPRPELQQRTRSRSGTVSSTRSRASRNPGSRAPSRAPSEREPPSYGRRSELAVGSTATLDPFQYMTMGPAPNVSTSSLGLPGAYRSGPASVRGSVNDLTAATMPVVEMDAYASYGSGPLPEATGTNGYTNGNGVTGLSGDSEPFSSSDDGAAAAPTPVTVTVEKSSSGSSKSSSTRDGHHHRSSRSSKEGKFSSSTKDGHHHRSSRSSKEGKTSSSGPSSSKKERR